MKIVVAGDVVLFRVTKEQSEVINKFISIDEIEYALDKDGVSVTFEEDNIAEF